MMLKRRMIILNRICIPMILSIMLLFSGCSSSKKSEQGNKLLSEFVSFNEDIETVYNSDEKMDTESILFFHNTACGTCDGTKNFSRILSEKLMKSPYKLYAYNVFKTEEWKTAKDIFLEYDRKIEDITFPAVIINGVLYEGMESIEQNLQKEYFQGAILKVIYYYRHDCKECMELEKFLDNFPKTVVIGEETVPVILVKRHTRIDDNGDKIRWFFEKYEVPEEDQKVPFMVIGDHYLAGAEEIQDRLLMMLQQGHGLWFCR